MVFVLQNINRVYVHSPVEGYLELSSAGLAHGFIWQLLTFQFLHWSSWHFFLNSVMLFIFGRPVEMALGRGRFLEVYFFSGAMGGLLQGLLGLVFPTHFGLPTMGASAGVSGLLAMFCLLHRDQTILFMFVLPMRAWHLLIASLFVAGFFVLVPAEPGIAHAAHLGGMLAAMAYEKWFLRRERRLFNWRAYSDVLRSRRIHQPRSEPDPGQNLGARHPKPDGPRTQNPRSRARENVQAVGCSSRFSASWFSAAHLIFLQPWLARASHP